MRQFASLITAISLLLATPVFADDVQRGRQLWTDPDGSPDQTPFSEVTTPSGGATDDGDGTMTLNFAVSASPTFTGDVTISDTSPSLVFTDTTSSEDDFELIVDGSVVRYVNTTDGITTWIHYASNVVGLGEVGFAPSAVWIVTDGTGDGEVMLPANSIGPGEIASMSSADLAGIISDETGSGLLVFSSSPTLTTPTIGSFANATHDHQAASGGGTLDHGLALTGLTDDDHTQYVLVDGTRAMTGNLDIQMAVPVLKLTDTTGSEDDFELVVQSSVFRITNTTDNVTSLIHYADNAIGLGEVGTAPSYIWMVTDGTGNNEFRVPTDSIGVDELDTADEPTDGESLTFQSSSGRMVWASGNGDITSVGDVSSGAAFDGTQGTTLTFNNAGGDATISYDGTNITLSKPIVNTSAVLTTPNIGVATATTLDTGEGENELFDMDQNVLIASDVTHRIITSAHTIPSFVWTDSDGDDFEAVVQDHVLRVANTSDGITSLIHYADNSVGLGELGFAPAYQQFITDGTGDGEFRVPANSINLGGGGLQEVTGTLPQANGGTAVTSLSDILGTTNQVSVSGGTARVIGGNVTLSTPQDIHTAATPTFGELTLSSASPVLVFTDSGGDDFEHDLTSSVYRIANTTDGITGYIHDASNTVGFGEVGHAPSAIRLVTDGTGDGEVILPAESIGRSELDSDFTQVGIEFIIDGGGSAITTGQKGHLEIPFDMVVTQWTILADQSGSISVAIWKDTYANFPPTTADLISGDEPPSLSTAQKNQDTALATWTTTLTEGDILAYNVDSITTCQRVTISIRGYKI